MAQVEVRGHPREDSPVQRVIPPALLTRVGNPLLSWLLSGRRRSAKVGQSLILLHVTGRRTERGYSTPLGYHRQPDGRLLVLTSASRLGIRVTVDRVPTLDELAEAARRDHLSVLLLDVAGDRAGPTA